MKARKDQRPEGSMQLVAIYATGIAAASVYAEFAQVADPQRPITLQQVVNPRFDFPLTCASASNQNNTQRSGL